LALVLILPFLTKINRIFKIKNCYLSSQLRFKNSTFLELYYLRLPKDIKDYRVILMDATVATGAAAMMAIRVLLDHDVKEENINLVIFENGVEVVLLILRGYYTECSFTHRTLINSPSKSTNIVMSS
jgi:uracil phosphoribosyltransferase